MACNWEYSKQLPPHTPKLRPMPGIRTCLPALHTVHAEPQLAHHLFSCRQAKRLKKLRRLLSCPAAQAAMARYWTCHKPAIASALVTAVVITGVYIALLDTRRRWAACKDFDFACRCRLSGCNGCILRMHVEASLEIWDRHVSRDCVLSGAAHCIVAMHHVLCVDDGAGQQTMQLLHLHRQSLCLY